MFDNMKEVGRFPEPDLSSDPHSASFGIMEVSGGESKEDRGRRGRKERWRERERERGGGGGGREIERERDRQTDRVGERDVRREK